jgi:hypothetical protein
MAQAQIDLSSFPDQAGASAQAPRAAPPPAGAASPGPDLSTFPDQPKAPPRPVTVPPAATPPTPRGFLGDSTKKASIGPPESWPAYFARKARETGKAVKTHLPDIGGATGAMVGAEQGAAIGGTIGAVSLPVVGAVPGAVVGGVTGGIAGAGLGGTLGKYAEMLTDIARNPSKYRSSSPLEAGKKVASGTAQALQAGNQQMGYQMAGEVLALPLGFVRRGGFVNITPEIADTLAADKQFGTRLSGPELTTGSRIGNMAKSVQSYTGGAFLGGELQREARTEGAASATQNLERAIRTIATPQTKVTAGQAAEAGIGAAQRGLKARGAQMEAAIQAAEARGPVDQTNIKNDAVRIFQKDVLPLLVNYPDLSGSAKRLVQKLANDPTLIQRNPRPIMLAVADAVLEKTNSPVVKLLRSIIDSEDEVTFRGMMQMRSRLRQIGKQPDELLSGAAKGIATHFENQFKEALFAASPDFAKASADYGVGARLLKTKALQTIFKTAIESPEAVVASLSTPTRATRFKQALNALANSSTPDDSRQARAAYDVVRSTLWTEKIVKGGKQGVVDLPGMAARIRENEDTLRVLFGDRRGAQVLANGKAIAHLFEKQSPAMAGNFRKMFEIGRLVAGAIMVFKGSPTGMTLGAIWEGFPDVFTWAIHDPKTTKWFIEGARADNPRDLTTNAIRFWESYRKSHQPPGKPETSTAPPTP